MKRVQESRQEDPLGGAKDLWGPGVPVYAGSGGTAGPGNGLPVWSE